MKKSIFINLIAVICIIFCMSATVLSEEKGSAALPVIVKDMIENAKASVPKVSAADVKAAIDKKEKVVFLDVRDGEEYSEGHIPGALNISRGTLEMHVWGKIPDQKAKIYVYCKTSARSALAAKTLQELGYTNVFLVDATFNDWMRAGYPVIR